jgi:hypothetical protein
VGVFGTRLGLDLQRSNFLVDRPRVLIRKSRFKFDWGGPGSVLRPLKFTLVQLQLGQPVYYDLSEALCFLARIVEPICRLDATQLPAQSFQNFLPQAITIAGRFRGMIRRTVTFNPENETVRPLWMTYADIDKISRNVYLRDRNATDRLYLVYDEEFEIGIRLPLSNFAGVKNAACYIFKPSLSMH